ncbi:hypothetical protein FOA52_007942 [Chlamydomonas sp. UWO 241]|nr:hypothetical protein FOA52_007942 [Chlamydomonas sp. UWO 241]
MAQVSYISRADLERMRAKVADVPEDTFQREEKRRLKELSDTRAAGWPNTLSAQRARKDRAQKERLAAEEAERIQIDKGEAALRAEERRLQIERANKILFDESDRVRGFHSTLQKADVIQENEALIGFKKQIGVLREAQESAFVEQQKQALDIAEQAELAKFAAERERALKQRDVQLQQVDDFRTRIIAERVEEKHEGQLIKARAVEEATEMREKEAERRRKAQDLSAAVGECNRTLQGFKLKELEKAREADRAMEEYARKKAEVIVEREKRMKEKAAGKEAERKRVADQIEKNFNDWMSKEKGRLDRDVAEAELKAQEDEASRKRRQREQLADINRTNQAQLVAKADVKVRERADGVASAAEWTERMKSLKREEAEEESLRKTKCKQVESFQLRQGEMKARRKAMQKVAEMQDAAQMELTIREQESVFQQYASEWVDEYRRQGKTTKPMEHYLNKKETLVSMR